MIRKVSKIENVGKYESFSGSELLEKNTIIFGFNGAGKSTLSDIFYSLLSEEKVKMLLKRRTLNRDGEEETKEIGVILCDENENNIIFSNGKWNTLPNNLHVFNKHYIEDHVFVSKHYQGDVVPIGMGPLGTKCMKRKEFLLDYNINLLNKINEDIAILSKAGLKIKDFSSQKVSERTKSKRFENMASLELYQLSEKEIIENKIKNNTKYSKELGDIEYCEKIYQQIRGIDRIDKSLLMKTVNKTLRVSSKDISHFLSETLTVADIRWAVLGYKNQKNKEVCPMCGQTISDKRAIALFKKLGKYVSQNKGDNIREFCEKLNLLAGQLRMLDLTKKIERFNEIVHLLDSDSLLLKKDMDRLKKGLSWNGQNDFILEEIIKKIYDKSENPYISTKLSEEEKQCIALINDVIRNIYILEDIIAQAKERLNRKIDRKINMSDINNMFELSYGSYRDVAERIKTNAGRYLRNSRKIMDLNEQIDDCYNQIQ